MEDKKLVVQMLGSFNLSYDGIPIVLERNSTTKATQLFLYLLHHRDEKIPRDILINILYGNEDLSNPANNLKVNLFRLRKILSETILPKNNYISFKSGMYSFNSKIQIESDSELFAIYAEKALADTTPTDEKMILLQRVIDIYKGEFLPMLTNVPWVVLENLKYQELYIRCIKTACNILNETGDLLLMLDICNRAVQIYPFNEDMHLLKIKCLIDMKRYSAALDTYEETTKMFFEELGVSPSQKMLSLYKQMTSNIKLSTSSIEQIKDSISEKGKISGAYYCNYLGFVDSYRFIARVIERSGQSIFLSLFTLTNVQGNPLGSGEKLTEAVEALSDVIRTSLRRGDLYTRYSPNQFLVLLIGINYENCSVVSDRIKNKFKESKNIRGVRLQHSAISGVDFKKSVANNRLSEVNQI